MAVAAVLRLVTFRHLWEVTGPVSVERRVCSHAAVRVCALILKQDVFAVDVVARAPHSVKCFIVFTVADMMAFLAEVGHATAVASDHVNLCSTSVSVHGRRNLAVRKRDTHQEVCGNPRKASQIGRHSSLASRYCKDKLI